MVMSPRYAICFVAAIGLLVVIALFLWRRAIDLEIQEKLSQLTDTYGVVIHYRYEQRSFFPDRLKSANASQEALWRIKRLIPVFEEFFSAYPVTLIRQNLSALYVAKDIRFSGKIYGGTYLNAAIYINTNARDSFVLGTLHSELSSILMHKYSFPSSNWTAVNIPGWSYSGTGFEMLGEKDLDSDHEERLRHGFLKRYAQSSLENDFNEFVALAFTSPRVLCELVSKYERIRKKNLLVVEFYKSIDPRIDIPTCDASGSIG